MSLLLAAARGGGGGGRRRSASASTRVCCAPTPTRMRRNSAGPAATACLRKDVAQDVALLARGRVRLARRLEGVRDARAY
jgi:hypothetical protein